MAASQQGKKLVALVDRYRGRQSIRQFAARSAQGVAGRKRMRHGISLLEVLFSVGVLLIGLLGVAILLPVAAKSARDGLTIDRAARNGLNWVREFQMRGYCNPRTWLIAGQNGGGFAYDPVQPFCIDPNFASVNGDSVFPYVPNSQVFMRRITVPSAMLPNGNPVGLIDREQAREVFTSQDETTFDRPPDLKLPAQPVFSSVAGMPVKRLSDGRLSWFATIVPKMESLSAGQIVSDFYTLSIVVVANRDPAFATTSMFPKPDNERVLNVVLPPNTGFQGGEITLQTKPGRPPIDIQLRRGDWVVLSGLQQYVGISNPVPVFRWYQVSSTSDVVPDPTDPSLLGPYAMDVTLQGPDWDYNVMPMEATVVTGVIAVYEKTVRREFDSLFTN